MLWISAGSVAKITQDFRAGATKLGVITEESQDDDKKCAIILKNWLQSEDVPWLLIFDNADEPILLEDYWPITESGSILLTSRNPASARIRASGNFSKGRQVTSLSDDEGVQLFLTLLHEDISMHEDSSTANSKEMETARALAKELGGLPLAINQMATYMQETECSLEGFFELFIDVQNKNELLKEGSTQLDIGYPYIISTVFDLSLSRVTANGRHLLELMSFYDPDSIPESLFIEKPEFSGHIETFGNLRYLSNKLRYLEAVKSLLGQSLISKNKDEGTYSMHRLLSVVTLSKMNPNDKQARFDEAGELLHRIYPRLTPAETYLSRHWLKLRLYLPHVLSLERQYREAEILLLPTAHFATILCSAGWFLFEQTLIEQALSILPTAKALGLATKADNEFTVASIYRSYGVIKLHLKHDQQCLDNFKAMLEVLEEFATSDTDFVLADGYNGCGLAEIGLDNFEAAEEYLNKSLHIRHLHPEMNPAMRGMCYGNVAILRGLQHDYEGVLKMVEKELPLVEEGWGVGSYKTAECYYERGNGLIGLNRMDEAFTAHSKALNIRQATLGDGYKFAASLHKVGWLFSKRGEYHDAELLLAKVLKIYSTSYQVQGEIARTSYLISSVLTAQGKDEDAKNTKAMAVKIRREITGQDPEDDDFQESYDKLISFMER